MRKPNKIERMNAYLYAWAILTERIDNPFSEQRIPYLCPMLKLYYIATTGSVISMYSVTRLYPEFAKQKPYRMPNLDVWWPELDKQSRIKALENAIKLLA